MKQSAPTRRALALLLVIAVLTGLPGATGVSVYYPQDNKNLFFDGGLLRPGGNHHHPRSQPFTGLAFRHLERILFPFGIAAEGKLR